MRPSIIACAIVLLSACGGAQDRPEPPSGAVDPGFHGLATPGERAARATDPAVPSIGGASGKLPAAGGAAPPSAPAAEASGNVVMTREHCDALGRKFAELTMAQGGQPSNGPIDREAEGVGKTFAAGCARDMVGKDVPLAEYQCMLRAKASDELLGCKR